MAKNNELFYGQSGTGKSEAALRVASRVLAQRPKTKVRVVVGDGSAATYHASGLVEEGLIEVASWEGRDWPISTLYQFAEGYWPADVNDPKSPLIKPTAEELARISVWIFEGLTVAGAYVLGDAKGGLASRAAAGEKMGQDAPVRIKDCEQDKLGNCIDGKGPGLATGTVSPGHYNIAQKRIQGFIDRVKGLPGEFTITTAHERAAEDKLSKEIIIGPEVAGGALTAGLQKHYNDTLHFATAEKRVKVKDEHTQRQIDDLDVEFRIYTRDHISAATGMKFKAVTRGGLTAAQMPLYLTSEIPGDAIEEYYRIINTVKDVRRAAARALAGLDNAPASVL